MVIPKNLDECFTELEVMLGRMAIEDIKSEKESDIYVFHRGLSTSIKNSWKLWEPNSPLTQYFNQLGVYHADDMSDIIIAAFWRYLNDKPINLEEMVNHYREFWISFDGGANNTHLNT